MPSYGNLISRSHIIYDCHSLLKRTPGNIQHFKRSNYYIMTATIENPCYNGIDVAFKKLNITSHDINKSIPSSDEMLLFKPKIVQAINFVREKKECPDLISIYARTKFIV